MTPINLVLMRSKNKSFIYFYKVLTKFSLKYSDLYTVTSLSDKNFLENNFKKCEGKNYKKLDDII